jgi:hypothetical protein
MIWDYYLFVGLLAVSKQSQVPETVVSAVPTFWKKILPSSSGIQH